MENDPRTVDKLINGQNNVWEDKHMWLAPFNNTATFHRKDAKEQNVTHNSIFFAFEKPIAISEILVWNYAKTPTRGVNEYEILIDEYLIYKGYLKQAPSEDEASRLFNQNFVSSVIFSSNERAISQESRQAVNFDHLKI
jgi:hypothetical protein